MRCENCKWWADHKQRVFAKIPRCSPPNCEMFDLRRCNFTPPPAIQENWAAIYTPEDYVCSAFAGKEMEKSEKEKRGALVYECMVCGKEFSGIEAIQHIKSTKDYSAICDLCYYSQTRKVDDE